MNYCPQCNKDTSTKTIQGMPCIVCVRLGSPEVRRKIESDRHKEFEVERVKHER